MVQMENLDDVDPLSTKLRWLIPSTILSGLTVILILSATIISQDSDGWMMATNTRMTSEGIFYYAGSCAKQAALH